MPRMVGALLAAGLLCCALAQDGAASCKSMRVKELRTFLAARGVKCEGCAEKERRIGVVWTCSAFVRPVHGICMVCARCDTCMACARRDSNATDPPPLSTTPRASQRTARGPPHRIDTHTYTCMHASMHAHAHAHAHANAHAHAPGGLPEAVRGARGQSRPAAEGGARPSAQDLQPCAEGLQPRGRACSHAQPACTPRQQS